MKKIDIMSKDKVYLEVGDLIKRRYKVLAYIDRGSFGQVYKVHDKYNNGVYALKRIKIQENDISIPFEYDVLPKMNHENIISSSSIFRTKKFYYIKMVLHDTNLRKVLETGTNQTNVFKCLAQVLHALDYLEDQQIVHRDVKPDNILIMDVISFKTSLSDFGISFEMKKDKSLLNSLGTLAYSSPEVLLGETDKIGPASDIWSFGSVLYYCLTGDTPVSSNEILNIIPKKHCSASSLDKKAELIICLYQNSLEKINDNKLKLLLRNIFVREPSQRPKAKAILTEDFCSPFIKDLTPKYLCPICRKELGCSQNLQLHILRHDEKNKIYKCLFCSKAYVSEAELKLHIKRNGHSINPVRFILNKIRPNEGDLSFINDEKDHGNKTSIKKSTEKDDSPTGIEESRAKKGLYDSFMNIEKLIPIKRKREATGKCSSYKKK